MSFKELMIKSLTSLLNEGEILSFLKKEKGLFYFL